MTDLGFNLTDRANSAHTTGSAAADALLDIADTATTMRAPTAPNNVTLYAEKLHPTTLGYTNLASVYSAAINAQVGA